MPKISVLIPAYNTKEEYLREAIESVLNQTFSDFELIILDDGSTGGNIEAVVKSYADPRIRFYRNKTNLGISNERIKMRSILVTGANGYIGHHVVRHLCDMCPDDKILAVDFRNNDLDERAEFSDVNILTEADSQDLFTKLKQPDICIHLAWQDGFNHKSDAHLANLSAHFHFLRNLIEHGCKSISVMGTMHEVGYWEGEINADTPCNPLSMYGIAKNALRQALLTYSEDKNVSVKWLRAYYITGDDKHNKSIFGKILQMAEEGQKNFPLTSGVNQYDFIDVETLAEYIATASIQNEIAGIINVCSGKPVALKDKVESFIKEKGLDIRLEYGVFPTRKYDSPAIWGNADLINEIMKNKIGD